MKPKDLPQYALNHMSEHVSWLVKQRGHRIYQNIDPDKVIKMFLKKRDLIVPDFLGIPEGFRTYTRGILDGISIAYTKMGR